MERPLDDYSAGEIMTAVSDRYGQVARAPGGDFNFPVGRKFAESVGYPASLLDELPASLWESFTGAGNPKAHSNLEPGSTVLDLGCGAGLDLVLYARAVGAGGRVIGVDLSPAMAAKARANLRALSLANAEVLEGASDRLPLPDASVDVVCSNGIYNLSPDKRKAFGEVYRVLKPGGRTEFAEVVLKDALPPGTCKGIDDWFRCIGGALPETELVGLMRGAGFEDIRVVSRGRNARTGHPLAVCAVIRAGKGR